MKKAVSVVGHAEEAEKMYVQKEEKHFAPFSILLFSTISKHKYLAFLLNSEHEKFSENE